jgi:hypothetical protein
MSDIVERLLNDAESHYEVARSADMRPEDTLNWKHGQNCQEAANTITRLTAENEKLAEALETAGRLFAASRDENARLTAEVRVRQTIVEEARDERDAALAEMKKLRAALARIENEGDGTHAVALARAALSGDKQ